MPDFPDSPRHQAFKNMMGVLERSLQVIDPAAVGARSNNIINVFNNMRQSLLVDLEIAYPEVRSRKIQTQAEGDSAHELIARALNTARAAGRMIYAFMLQNPRQLDSHAEIYEAIKPFIRDSLNVNLGVHYYLNYFGTQGDGHELRWNDEGKIVAKYPSYLHTTAHLSGLFKSEQDTLKFINQAIQLGYGKATFSDDLATVRDFLINYIMCTDFSTNMKILTAIRADYQQSGVGLDHHIKVDWDLLAGVSNGLKRIENNRLNGVPYRQMTVLFERHLPSLLLDSNFKTTLLGMLERKEIFSVPTSILHISRTRGCPAYFHNLALDYVAKGLYACKFIPGQEG